MIAPDAAPARASLRGREDLALGLVAVIGLVAGGLFRLSGLRHEADLAWGIQIGIMLVPLGLDVGRTLPPSAWISVASRSATSR